MNFDDYASRHGFALFPCRAGTKTPSVKWTKESSSDLAQWQAWRAAGFNLAINAAQSGLIILDVDSSKIGRDAAWAAWCKLSSDWGVAIPPAVQCQSARGGWHCYARRPDGIDPASLSGTKILVHDEKGRELIGVKVRGYAVAPGSSFESQPYVQISESPPHECPPALLQALQLPVISAPSGVAGESDPIDVAALVAFLDAHGEFSTEPEWFRALGAIKLALGDTDDGVAVAHQITFEEVTHTEFHGKWDRLSSEPRPRDYTVASMIWRAEQLGRKFYVRRSSKAIFEGVASLAPATLPPGATPLVGGGPRQVQIVAPEYSEIEIADRFANDYASGLRYITSRKVWLYWTGKRWRLDETEYVANLARGHCRNEAALCASRPGTNNARTLCSDRTVNAVLRLARMDQRIATRVDDWDQDPWLLGTPDGVVDLRTGTLRAARPEDHVTKSTAVSPAGDCPLWLGFLKQVTNGDADLLQYLQKLAGYAATGSTAQQELFFLHGPGRTGKGTFTHALQGVMGDYHRTTAIETLTESKQDRHPAEVAVLQGARLVTCSETERGRNWAESRIKQLTGEDPISARFMNGNPFDFLPTLKLFISGNYKPHLRPDSAMRRRIRLIPFTRVIADNEVDPNLGAKLREEWPGILAWAIAGAVAWQQEGLQPPACVLEATRDYMDVESEDTLTMWIEEKCDISDSAAKTAHRQLYDSYSSFAKTAGEKDILSSEKLGKALGEMGYRGVRDGKARYRKGIRLAPPESRTNDSATATAGPAPGNTIHSPWGASLPSIGGAR